LCNVPVIPVSIASCASTSSLLSLGILPPKRVPTKDPSFLLGGKRKEDVLLQFPAVPQEDAECVSRTKILMKPDSTVKSVVSGKCDTRYNTLRAY
jgi:hypothetical protein